METMIELTVVFENPAITPLTYLTGPFDGDLESNLDGDIGHAMSELRDQANVQLGEPVADERCFYRFFRR